MRETIKQRLSRGELLVVCAVGRIPHHNLVQMLGVHGGFQAIWIDLEHTDFSSEKIETLAIAARSCDMDSFARIPPTDYATVTRALEAGAGGIMAAQIRSAAQAEELVKWTKFMPRGYRGLNSMGWDGGFGTVPLAEFTEQANRENFVAMQIETLGGLEECEAIAAIDGVDMLFVGPADLSQSLGVTGDFWNPKCLAAVDRVAAACKQHGKSWGVVPVSPEYAAMCVDKGCQMLSVAADARIINVGLAAIKQNYATYFPTTGNG